MRPCPRLVICCLLPLVALLAAEPSSKNASAMDHNLEVMALEKTWTSTHQPSYFNQALTLLRTRAASPLAETGFHVSQLDLASGILLKSHDGAGFGAEAGAVRHCQAEVVGVLAAVDVDQLKTLPEWSGLRARYARLLMRQRAIWMNLRDPLLDGKPIELDSSVRMQPDPKAEERLRRNQAIALQADLKRFLSDTGPATERFLVAAYALEPRDFRELNELLDLGGYTPADRTRLVTTVAKTATGLPDIVKLQLP